MCTIKEASSKFGLQSLEGRVLTLEKFNERMEDLCSAFEDLAIARRGQEEREYSSYGMAETILCDVHRYLYEQLKKPVEA